MLNLHIAGLAATPFKMEEGSGNVERLESLFKIEGFVMQSFRLATSGVVAHNLMK